MVLFLKAEIHVIVRSLATTLSPMQNLSHCLNPDIIYTTLCSLQQTYYIHNWSNNVVHMQLISYIHNVGRWRQLTHENLVLTNQTKLTLTVAQTLTDTVTVIFLTHISSTPMKRLYRNNKRNFCGGAVARFVDVAFFWLSPFLVCGGFDIHLDKRSWNSNTSIPWTADAIAGADREKSLSSQQPVGSLWQRAWTGPVFPFSHFLPVCWQEFDSKFILYRWKEGFFVGIYKKKGLGLLWA